MKRIIILLTALFTGAVFFTRCNDASSGTGGGGTGSDSTAITGSSTADAAQTFDIQFNAHPPKELSATASEAQLVSFAWNEFLALNWKSSYRQNGLRDTPDTTWSYDTDKSPYPDLQVWETYAHRTELRPFSDSMEPFDNRPHYSYKFKFFDGGLDPYLFDNLDENNEIGSCDVYGQTTANGKKIQVLYQAKVNREEYDYLYNNYNTHEKLTAARDITLYNIRKYGAYYPGAGTPCDCPPDQHVLCLPCGGSPDPNSSGQTRTGAIEIKTAWRQLAPGEDTSHFFRRKVIVYTPGVFRLPEIANKEYALIAIHIIHKTQNYPNFVFATFEQEDVQQQNMGYVELNDQGVEGNNPLIQNYPRFHPIPQVVQDANNYVHSLLAGKNANSVWQHYRLVGVQGTPTNDPHSFNYFLANYVVESDSVLGNFHGNGIGTPYNDSVNSLYKGRFYTMGGCQGCHGVAQTKLGADCSFLMDSIGKPVVKPDNDQSGNKLQRYIMALRKINATRLTPPRAH